MIVMARELRKGDILQIPDEHEVGAGKWYKVERVKVGTESVMIKLEGQRRIASERSRGWRIR